MTSLFDPVIKQVIGLVEAQVLDAKGMNHSVEVCIPIDRRWLH
jgi:hypothetical protein